MQRILFILIFLTFITLPHLQGRLFKLRAYPVGGYEKKVPCPELSLNAFLEGTYQEDLSKYINQYIGLRSYFVRTDNQITISLFKQTSPKTGSQLVIGKDKFLIETAYVRALNNKYSFDNVAVRKSAEQLQKIQNYLKSKNKALLLIIAPSKAELYKERIPNEFLDKEIPAALTQTVALKNHLNELNVNFVDGPTIFNKLKNELNFPVFPNTGAHWSYYSACLMLQTIIANVEKQLTTKMLELDCGEASNIRGPMGTDKDLLNLINIWWPRDFMTDNHYSLSKVNEPANFTRPRMLIVGDSFVWQLLKYSDKYNLFSQRDYFYYFNANHSKRGIIPNGKIDLEKLDWKRIFSEKDVVLIEINEIYISTLGFGFLDHAVKYIESQKQ